MAKGATHLQLKILKQTLHEQMDKGVHNYLIKFYQPWFNGIDLELFDGVTRSYAQHIVSAIWDMALNYPNACNILLVKNMS